MDKTNLLKLPKVELHCHLDGSIPKKFFESELGRKVLDDEIYVSSDCKSLNEYLDKFNLPISILNTKDRVKNATIKLLEKAKEENVRYIEIRFSPILLQNENLSSEDAVIYAIEGIKKGKELYDIDSNLILCAMRHFNKEDNLYTLSLTKKYLNKGVCCMDLAGAEKLYPTCDFEYLFKEASKLKVPFIIHAGETGSSKSIKDAVDFGAKRIGHGIAMKENKKLQEYIKEKNIYIEMCPNSNYQTKAVSYAYPLREFIDNDILVTVNTDNRTVSNTTLTDELIFLQKINNLTDREICSIERNSLRASFADDKIKEKILQEIDLFEKEYIFE